MSLLTDLDKDAELERIRLYTLSARQRIRRLDVLLDEQVRILKLDPALRSRFFKKRKQQFHTYGMAEIRVFAAGFTVAGFAVFYLGYWLAKGH